MATVQEKVSFQPIQKKDNFKECSASHALALISLASKEMIEILQAKLQQYMNWELPDVQTGLRNQRSNCQHPLDNRQSNGIPENHFCLLHWLWWSLFLCVDHNKLWKILKEMGVLPGPRLSRIQGYPQDAWHWRDTERETRLGFVQQGLVFLFFFLV